MSNQQILKEDNKELKNDTKSYMVFSYFERMKIVEKYLEDEEKLNNFLNSLEENLHFRIVVNSKEKSSEKEEIYGFLEKIAQARGFLKIKSAYKKMICEYLSLTAPVIND